MAAPPCNKRSILLNGLLAWLLVVAVIELHRVTASRPILGDSFAPDFSRLAFLKLSLTATLPFLALAWLVGLLGVRRERIARWLMIVVAAPWLLLAALVLASTGAVGDRGVGSAIVARYLLAFAVGVSFSSLLLLAIRWIGPKLTALALLFLCAASLAASTLSLAAYGGCPRTAAHCIAERGQTQNDPDLCSGIAHSAECFAALALSRKDIGICDRAQFAPAKQHCEFEYVRAIRNPEECESLRPQLRRQCFWEKADSLDRPELCQRAARTDKFNRSEDMENCCRDAFSYKPRLVTEEEIAKCQAGTS
jgi:hypothetical protein